MGCVEEEIERRVDGFMSYTKCYQCDRCGKYILKGNVYKFDVGKKTSGYELGERSTGHWCMGCYDKFVDFLESDIEK